MYNMLHASIGWLIKSHARYFFCFMQISDIERAHALEDNADFVGALRLYRDAYTQNSSDSDAVLGIAQNAMALDNPELALEFFVKLLILDHRNPWGFLGRAQVMARYNQVERAISDVRHALELEAEPGDLRIDCAAVLNDCGAFEAAIETLAPVREQFGADADFCAEWIFGSIAAGKADADVREMLDFAMQQNDDPLLILCGFALDKMAGAELPHQRIGEVLKENPDLEWRAEALGLI